MYMRLAKKANNMQETKHKSQWQKYKMKLAAPNICKNNIAYCAFES